MGWDGMLRVGMRGKRRLFLGVGRELLIHGVGCVQRIACGPVFPGVQLSMCASRGFCRNMCETDVRVIASIFVSEKLVLVTLAPTSLETTCGGEHCDWTVILDTKEFHIHKVLELLENCLCGLFPSVDVSTCLFPVAEIFRLRLIQPGPPCFHRRIERGFSRV